MAKPLFKDTQTDNRYGVVNVFTHGVLIYAKDDRVKVQLRAVLKEWTVFGDKRVELPNGESVVKLLPTNHYGNEIGSSGLFYLHKGQLRTAETALKSQGIEFADFDVRIIEGYKPSKVNLKLKEGRVLREYQDDAKAFSLAPVKDGDHFSKLIAMPTGTGKSVSRCTEVITETGDKPVAELSVGEKIMAEDGHFYEVLGIYPQGLREAIDVVTEDGRSNIFDKQHLWNYKTDPNSPDIKQGTTEEMLASDAWIPLFKNTNEDNPIHILAIDRLSKFFSGKPLTVGGDGMLVYQKCNQVDGDDVTFLIHAIGGVAYKSDESIAFRAPNVNEFLSLDYLRDIHNLDTAAIDLSGWVKVHGRASYRETEDMLCISVESPNDLFVTNRYIVTHNTVTSCGIAAENQERLMIAVLPKYIKKWKLDICNNLDIKEDEIGVIDEKKLLIRWLKGLKQDPKYKKPPVFLITLTVWRGFMEAYFTDPYACYEEYGAEPWEICKLLDVGMFAIDEAHEHLNTVFMIAMSLHGPKFIAMSGTMRTEDAFQEKVQNVIFPQIRRYLDVKMEKYIDVEFIGYSFVQSLVHKMRYQAFNRTDYSHPTLEKSIMKYPAVLRDYIGIVTDLIDYDYIPQKEADEKALVFVGTVEMADKVIETLRTRYPKLDVVRYCAAQGDDYETVLTADITVSTLQSSGTAVDIPELTTGICTTMVNSSKSNIQALGRLRKLASGKKVTMYMPFCKQIQKHHKYMAFRYELFKDITKSIKTFNYHKLLGS